MGLKTFVKVGKITNLSDARYCSGMGVDILGFRVIPTDADYLTPERFKEFRGWFTGPAVVAEAFGLNSSEELKAIIENYQPDYIELSVTELEKLNSSSLPIILSGTTDEIKNAITKKNTLSIKYLLLTTLPDTETVEQLSTAYNILVEIKEENDLNEVDVMSTCIIGISLHGSPEEKPGLKSYDLLSDVLEKLEALD
jgi:phosphoribosylanthranilate isomerase